MPLQSTFHVLAVIYNKTQPAPPTPPTNVRHPQNSHEDVPHMNESLTSLHSVPFPATDNSIMNI